MNALIEAVNLQCGYGRLPVVRDLSLRVEAGEVVCLLGANGAGKTTTLLTIAGALPHLGGELQVLSRPVARARPYMIARRGLAMVPEGRGLFYKLSVADNLRLRRHRNSAIAMEELMKQFPALPRLLSRRAGLLSGGEQQMVALAGALIADPKVMLLDEMCLGLAPVIVEQLLPMVRRIAEEHSMGILLVEQHVLAALKIADRGYVMAHGRVVAEGPATELRRDAERLEASYLGDQPPSGRVAAGPAGTTGKSGEQ